MRPLAWVAIAVAGLGLGGPLEVGIFGSVFVHDDSGAMVSAVITNDREEQALLRLPGGLFFAVPRLEGTVEIRCRSGARLRWGYATGYSHLSLRAVGQGRCDRLVEQR